MVLPRNGREVARLDGLIRDTDLDQALEQIRVPAARSPAETVAVLARRGLAVG